jgi:hypothetical protein
MDLAAPHDEVLAQKDQANAPFLLYGYGSDRHLPFNRFHICVHLAVKVLCKINVTPAAA